MQAVRRNGMAVSILVFIDGAEQLKQTDKRYKMVYKVDFFSHLFLHKNHKKMSVFGPFSNITIYIIKKSDLATKLLEVFVHKKSTVGGEI